MTMSERDRADIKVEDREPWTLGTSFPDNCPPGSDVVPVELGELIEVLGKYGLETEPSIREGLEVIWCTHVEMVTFRKDQNQLIDLASEAAPSTACIDLYLRIRPSCKYVTVEVEGLSLLRFVENADQWNRLPWLPPVKNLELHQDFDSSLATVVEHLDEMLDALFEHRPVA